MKRICLRSQFSSNSRYNRAVVPTICILALSLFLGGSLWNFSDDQDIWKQAVPGYVLQFPRDHGSHPEFKIEWWYYTGNLTTTQGVRFGYQLTFFRIGVDRHPDNPSRWAIRDLFMTHFAVTNISDRSYRFADRMNRGGVGWAGASESNYHVWNYDWEVEAVGKKHRLKAQSEDIAVDLELDEGRPPTLHGSQGLSQKGKGAGNASYYYSLTRMPSRGTMTYLGKPHEVTGLSWMDHEFGTTFLEAEQSGWDWFSLQLDDGTDVMLFQIRRSDGSRDEHSSGTLISNDREATVAHLNGFDVKGSDPWVSPVSGASYPLVWKIDVPSQSLTLTARAAIPNQELRTEKSTRVTYWEGAIEVDGLHHGRSVHGRGYLEMTGYGDQPISEKFE